MSEIVVVVQDDGDISASLVGTVGPAGPTGPQGSQGIQGPVGVGIATGGTVGQYLRKQSLVDYDTAFATITPSEVGLGNVDNTSDLNKPVSTAQSAAITAAVNANGHILPSGVVVDYVNRCSILPQIDGLLMTSFDTSVVAYRNIAGGFNGGGRGNKSFISFNNYDGISFGDLTSLKFVAKLFNGASNLMFFNLMVDLVGSGNVADVALMIPKASNLFITGPTNTEQSIASTGDVWACVGGTGANGGSPVAGKAGIPPYTDQSVGFFCSLAHIMTYNPNAKLWNGALLDGGQPKNASLGSIQVVMGSSGTEAYSRNSLYNTTVGISGVETVYQFGAN